LIERQVFKFRLTWARMRSSAFLYCAILWIISCLS